MAIGKRTSKQDELFVLTAQIVTGPGHPFYAKLNAVLAEAGFDEFVETLCAPHYKEGGRPGIPPGVYFRMLFIGYFEGLDSQRGIAWRCADSLALRTFLGVALTEATPVHASMTIIRQRLPESVYDRVFVFVLGLLQDKGLLRGKTVAIDATTLEANAAMKSIVRKDTGEDWKQYLRGLAQAEGIENPTEEDLRRLDRGRTDKKVSNQEWQSPTDPDSRIARMKDGRTHLAYKAEHAVDLESEAIVGTTVTFADRSDPHSGPVTLSLAEANLVLAGSPEEIEEIVQDKGYHDNQLLADLAERGVRSYIPERRQKSRCWKNKPAGQEKAFRANRRRVRGRKGKRLNRWRSERCERTFAHVCETGGGRRTWLRGQTNVSKAHTLKCAAYNLGLLLRKGWGLRKPRNADAGGWGGLLAILTRLALAVVIVYRMTTRPNTWYGGIVEPTLITVITASALVLMKRWRKNHPFFNGLLGVLNDGLKILSNDTNNPTFILPLQGQGLNPAQLVVSDASGVISNRTEVFPGVDADGPGLQQAATNITLQNYGDVPIIIPSNGLSFNSTTQFLVSSIVSSTAGVINLSTNSAQIAPDTNETWTVTLLFDPSVAGTLTNMLSIYASNLLTQTTNVITNVAVSGTGLTRASLVVSNSTSATNNLAVSFGNVMNYSIGGPPSFATLTLINRGNQPLIIGQNGLTFSGNPGFSITNIVSSTSRVIDLTSTNTSMRTISTNETEIWTVTLMFKALSDGIRTNVLSIASNDPQNPITQVALSGVGVMPNITLDTPASQLDVSAGSTFTFAWQTTYPLTSATIALYLDTNSNAGSGLIPIASGIQNNGTNNSYTWQVSPTLVGTNYYVYATMTDGDGDVPGTSFAAGRLKIDPVGTFQLLSSVQSTNANYVYNYAFNGVTYTGTNELALGVNVIYVTNGTDIYQFIVTRVPELAQVDAVQYNQLNQVTTTTNGNGIVTTLTYDQLGRLVRRQSSNGAVVTYAYDVLGNRTSMTDYTGTTFYQYDDLNRLTAIIYSKDNVFGNGDDLTLSYEYDLAGRETAIVYPGGERIQYTYDNAGRISTVSNVTRSLSFQYTYNSGNGQLTRVTRPNGIETDYGYDGTGRLTNILHQVTSTSTLVAQFGYTLDAIGKATLLTTTLPGGVVKLEQYNYDYFDRLTNVIYGDSGVINSTALSVSYSYDGNGNRLTMTTKTNNAVTEIRYYTYGNENRLLSVTNQSGAMIATYGYDPAGNRIQKISTNNTAFYTYDERNLMTGYADATNQIAYTYNGDAQRMSQAVNGAVTNSIVDPKQSLFEVVQERNGTITASYTFGTTRLATWNGSAVTFELTDRIGSVRLVTDTSGNVIQSYNYDVFGGTR